MKKLLLMVLMGVVMAVFVCADGVDSYTKVMLHFDADPFVDSSAVPHTVAKTGNIFLRSNQYKFGGYSAELMGNSGYLTISGNNADWVFGNEDFTIDFWFIDRQTSGSNHIMGMSGSGNEAYWARLDHQTKVVRFEYRKWNNNYIQLSSPENSYNLNVWNHVAIVRSGSICKMYINGVEKGSDTSCGIEITSSFNLLVGAHSQSSYYDGYLDEFRVSKGIARWTSDFIPPTSPYSAPPIEPTVTEFESNPETTNFSQQGNMNSVPNMKLATGSGKVQWTNNVDVAGADLDSYIEIGDGFVSVDAANLDSSLNTSATVNINVAGCFEWSIYYAPTIVTSLSQLKGSGTLVGSSETGTCSSPCSNPSCTDGVLTFTMDHFDGVGGEGEPTPIPEFSIMTLGIGLLVVLAGIMIRKRF